MNLLSNKNNRIKIDLGVFPLIALLIVFFNINIFSDIKKADSLYELRGAHFSKSDIYADSANIDSAIREYRNLWNKTKDNTASWKLMRALYFKAYYTKTTQETRKRLYNEARKVGEITTENCNSCIESFAWLGIVIGVWGQEYGILRSAYDGVANKIKILSERVINLDSSYYDGVGYRVLGRLNFLAPQIPLILPWPSKKDALSLLEKSYRLNNSNLLTCQYYAEALYGQGKKEQAINVANEAINSLIVSDGIVEDTFTKREIVSLLKTWR
jgi:tetratricopeptide (TPR) repeat protein